MQKIRRAILLGAGGSGQAAEALLHREGALTRMLDERTANLEQFRAVLDELNPDAGIVSPGFAADHTWLGELRRRRITVLPELELGWSRRGCPAVAVTGSNGKSSVVKWLAEAFAAAGLRAVACGNYGMPVCQAVMLDPPPDWLVIEVSSFQLETVCDFRTEVAVLLNILPNHLDRHGSMAIYRALKFRLFEKQQAGDTAILPQEETGAVHLNPGVRRIVFGTGEEAAFRYAPGHAGSIDIRGTWFDNEALGPAAAAVAAVCSACGIPAVAVEESARAFQPLPHRTQTIAVIDGVRYIDDSKATNLAAMCAAVRRYPSGIHLIAGGRAKERDFSLAKDLLAQRVSHLYLIGESSSAMQEAWGKTVPFSLCETLDKAVQAAAERARPGEVVLFSPACTSFDQFSSFSERGDRFAAEVRGLGSGGDVK